MYTPWIRGRRKREHAHIYTERQTDIGSGGGCVTLRTSPIVYTCVSRDPLAPVRPFLLKVPPLVKQPAPPAGIKFSHT